MLHVVITCTASGFNDRCPDFQATVDPAAASTWYATTIRENAWTIEDNKPYCPRHNPNDNGAVIEVNYGDDYQPIGDSGWEIRLPRDGSGIRHTRVEVRQAK